MLASGFIGGIRNVCVRSFHRLRCVALAHRSSRIRNQHERRTVVLLRTHGAARTRLQGCSCRAFPSAGLSERRFCSRAGRAIGFIKGVPSRDPLGMRTWRKRGGFTQCTEEIRNFLLGIVVGVGASRRERRCLTRRCSGPAAPAAELIR